jgi:hypothetical protein
LLADHASVAEALQTLDPGKLTMSPSHPIRFWQLAIFPYFLHIYGMKTTLELPDQLFHAAKTRAAEQKRKLKDLVSEGLRTVLDSPITATNTDGEVRQVLNALDDILRCPPLPQGRVAELQANVRFLRAEGWSGEDL